MTQQIIKWYGLSLDVAPYVNVNAYGEFRDKLIQHLKTLPNIDLKNVEVYINQLEIETRPSKYGDSRLEQRVSNLDVSIETLKSAKERALIWFLNKDLPIKMNPDIEVRARAHKISYSLSGEYCANHRQYTDYVATAVKHDCPAKFRKLIIAGTAHATDSYGKIVKNIRPATTKIVFGLTAECQLSLTF